MQTVHVTGRARRARSSGFLTRVALALLLLGGFQPALAQVPASSESAVKPVEAEKRPDAAAVVPPADAAAEKPAEKVPVETQVTPVNKDIPVEPAKIQPAEADKATDPTPEIAQQPALDASQDGAQDPAPATTAISNIPHDLSPWGMFMAADIVVKSIMGLLAFASLITWVIWLAKSLELAGARVRARRALRIIDAASSMEDALTKVASRRGPVPAMLRAAGEEARRSDAAIGHAGGGGLKERVSSLLSRIEAVSGRRISAGTGILATIGSVAPFVGLLGTVWGIMNSFIGISQAQTTNLAVVAPGIAEALLATAIGLAAAIPAVVIYNAFARSVTGYRHLLTDAATAIERLVSRDLDFHKVPAAKAGADRLQAAE